VPPFFLSRKRLKNEEKSKIAFCFFRALLSQDDLCRASLGWVSGSGTIGDGKIIAVNALQQLTDFRGNFTLDIDPQ
jgi:hypothetical protein